ncbi:MAG: DUF3737 family protein [Clostridia bacterium]|nr:DUF3737 family protein [Clostridia bacterium]
MEKKIIEGQRFGEERALYNIAGLVLLNCTFAGPEDGESAVKECTDVAAKDCRFLLRYPLWHTDGITLTDCYMSAECRAAIWYSNDILISGTQMYGIKAVRECRDISLEKCDIISPEFGWRSGPFRIQDCSVDSEYAFFEAWDIHAAGLKLKGKYTFQYVKGGELDRCFLDTKDAFWHSEGLTVRDSVIKGEYLGWYSKNLTLINCDIEGTQPLCYCQGLKLVNCRMKGCDFTFEYSDVDADIQGEILSVKNVISGKVVADGYGEVMRTPDSKYEPKAQIIIRGEGEV